MVLTDRSLSFEELTRYFEESPPSWYLLHDEYESIVVAILTFRRPPPRPPAQGYVLQWIHHAYKKRTVNPDWFCVTEYARRARFTRAYLLIAGPQLDSKEHLTLRWREAGGGNLNILISDYRPGLFERTVLREARADSRFQLTMYREGVPPEEEWDDEYTWIDKYRKK